MAHTTHIAIDGTPVVHYTGLFDLKLDNTLLAEAPLVNSGMLDAGDGHSIYWEERGNPAGKPVLAVHGGPGSGASASWSRFHDPLAYRIILMDQRGCGRSTPNAGDTADALRCNTTQHLIADMEKLRKLLGIEKWMLFGGSWGTTLSLAYAVSHPERVSELLLWSVVTTRRCEVDWLTWQMGSVFPQEFERFLEPVRGTLEDGNIPLAYNRLLCSADPQVHVPASLAWCDWEDRIVSLGNSPEPDMRQVEERFRMCFTRLVTHYFGNNAFLDDDYITGNMERIGHIPMLMVRGRLDIAARLDIPWQLHRAHPLSDLYLIDDAGHGGADWMHRILVGAAEFFAR